MEIIIIIIITIIVVVRPMSKHILYLLDLLFHLSKFLMLHIIFQIALAYIARPLLQLNTIMNPFVYAWTIPDFRAKAKLMFTRSRDDIANWMQCLCGQKTCNRSGTEFRETEGRERTVDPFIRNGETAENKVCEEQRKVRPITC